MQILLQCQLFNRSPIYESVIGHLVSTPSHCWSWPLISQLTRLLQYNGNKYEKYFIFSWMHDTTIEYSSNRQTQSHLKNWDCTWPYRWYIKPPVVNQMQKYLYVQYVMFINDYEIQTSMLLFHVTWVKESVFSDIISVCVKDI